MLLGPIENHGVVAYNFPAGEMDVADSLIWSFALISGIHFYNIEASAYDETLLSSNFIHDLIQGTSDPRTDFTDL